LVALEVQPHLDHLNNGRMAADKRLLGLIAIAKCAESEAEIEQSNVTLY
jgi:hypothetical protein